MIIISYDELQRFTRDEPLIIVNGIIGQYLSSLDFEEKLQKRIKEIMPLALIVIIVVGAFFAGNKLLQAPSLTSTSSKLSQADPMPTLKPIPTSTPSSVNDESPILMIGGDGGEERIYLRYGIIFAYKDSSNKEYHIILSPTMHIGREDYNKLIFFKTPKEAESAGFKPSENFARDYACVKAGKDFYECLKE